jgi:hypothetical protein
MYMKRRVTWMRKMCTFLRESGEVVLCHPHPELTAEETYVPELVLICCFKNWCNPQDICPGYWREDVYLRSFQELGITVAFAERQWEGSMERTRFVFGCTLLPNYNAIL